MSTPYQMKDEDKTGRGLIPTTKAFDNPDFLSSHDARILRILCEFQEPQMRLKRNHVKGTVLFFGSARSMYRSDWEKTMDGLRRELAAAKSEGEKVTAQAKIKKFEKVEWMCQWTEVAEALSKRITEWAMKDSEVKSRLLKEPDYLFGHVDPHATGVQPLVVLTGGGPGIIEAANRGAAAVPGAKTMGMGISLPFEKGLNPYVTPDLAFEFHYFFTRKFWMMYSAKALIVGPGGFGTMDEVFELLTLRQTGKLPDIPIVFLGSQYWKTVVNWQAMADFGTISQEEVDRLCFADDVETAFTHIVSHLELSVAQAHTPSARPTGSVASPQIPTLDLGSGAMQ